MVSLQNTNLVWSLPLPKSHQQLSLFPGKGQLPDMASQSPSLSPPDCPRLHLHPSLSSLYFGHTDALCLPLSLPQGFVPSLSSAWKALSCSLACFLLTTLQLSAQILPPQRNWLWPPNSPTFHYRFSEHQEPFFTALLTITNLHLQLIKNSHMWLITWLLFVLPWDWLCDPQGQGPGKDICAHFHIFIT